MFESLAYQNDVLMMYWIFALAVIMEVVFTIQNMQLKWKNSTIVPFATNKTANRLNLPKEFWSSGFLERANFGSVSHRTTFILHNSLDGTLLNYTAKRIKECNYKAIHVSSSASSLHRGDKIFASIEEDHDTFTSVLWTANQKGSTILVEPAYSYPARNVYPTPPPSPTTTSTPAEREENILILPDFYMPEENPIPVSDTTTSTSTTYTPMKPLISSAPESTSTTLSSRFSALDSTTTTTSSTSSSLEPAYTAMTKSTPDIVLPPTHHRPYHHAFRNKFAHHHTTTTTVSTTTTTTTTEELPKILTPAHHKRTHAPHHRKHHQHLSEPKPQPEVPAGFPQYDSGLQQPPPPEIDDNAFGGGQQPNDYGFFGNNEGQRWRRQVYQEDDVSDSQVCPLEGTKIIWTYVWGIIAASPKSARGLHRYQIKDFHGRCLKSGGQFVVCNPNSLSTLWDVFKVNLTHSDVQVMF